LHGRKSTGEDRFKYSGVYILNAVFIDFNDMLTT